MTIDQLIDRARRAIDENDHPTALAILKSVLSRVPLNNSALVLAGRLFRVKSQHDRSQRFLMIAVLASPAGASAWTALGLTTEAGGDQVAAIRLHDRALRIEPLEVDALQNLGDVLLRAKRHTAAEDAYRKALLVLVGTSTNPRIGLMRCLLARGASLALAYEAARLALFSLDFGPTMRDLVGALLKSKQFGPAKTLLNMVSRRYSANVGVWRGLALAREFADDGDGALSAAGRVLLISPNDAHGLQILARLQLNAHPPRIPTKALERLKLIALGEKDGGAGLEACLILTGAHAIKREVHAEASRAFRYALLSKPGAVGVAGELAFACFANGDNTTALCAYRWSQAVDPGRGGPGENELRVLRVESMAKYCERNNLPYQQVEPAFTAQNAPLRKGRHHHGPNGSFKLNVDGRVGANEAISASHYRVPETFIARLNDPLVVPHQFSIITRDDHALTRGLFYHTPARFNFGPCFSIMSSDGRILAKVPREADEHQMEAVLLGGGQNYYHCMLDWFSRLSVLATRPDLSRLPMVVADNMLPAALEFLDLLGISSNRLIRVGNRPARFDTLWVPSLAHDGFGFVSPRYLDFLEEKVLRAIRDRNRPGTRRLYIARGSGSQRRVLNERELIRSLEAFDFEIIRPETLCLREQLEMFGEAEIVVGVIGAGLTNILAAPVGTQVIELTHSHSLRVNIEVLAGMLGHRFTRLVGHRMNPGSGSAAHSDLIAPIDKLIETITEAGRR
jgi:capsular polysaccharide biosynthesis protein/Tfp pilus assembly protein PilF